MADEHDLLDHPQVAGICLQCVNIKSDPDEDEDNYGEYSGAIHNDSYPIKNESMDCDIEQTQIIKHSISITSITSLTILQNETANVQIENIQNNRIILAKKPCSRYKPEPQRKTLFIMLEDCGRKLNTNPCFCKECQTLFVTRNDIDAHNMAAHSFLVPVKKPKKQESPNQTEDSPPLNQPKMFRLMLEDCGEKHNTSPCFCKECQTLFVIRNDIDAHNMAAHSFLVPVKKPQTQESPTQTEDNPPLNRRKMFQLMLEDCGEKLNTSPCFCKECQTLFVIRNDIDAHNMAAHSFLVPVKKHQTQESPTETEDRPPLNQRNMVQLMLEDFGEILNNSPCFCKECRTLFATRNAIDAHNMAEHSFVCMHCGLAFANTRALDAHISIHDQHTVTENSFRMGSFNHADEIGFNAKLGSECSISEIPKQNTSNTPKKRYKCIYYRCEKCYCSTSKFCNTVRHVCPVEKDTRLCHKCNNVFHRSGITLHNRKHDLTGITAADIVIKPFNANIKPGEWRVDLSKCQNCNAKFPTHLLNTHQCSTKAENSVRLILYRCKTCKEFFSFKENLEKHSKTCYRGRRKCIFKCKKCSRFMLSRAAVLYHTSEDSEDKTVIKPCKYCGWKFTTRSLHKHIKLHHHSLKLTPNDFCIEVIDTHCGALANVNKKSKKQLTNIPKDNIKPVVIKNAKETSVESSKYDMKPAFTTYKSRKGRMMDRALKKETNRKNDEADVKINVNRDIEDEKKIEQKKSSVNNEKAGHNTIQYDNMKNVDSEKSLLEDSSVDQTKNNKPSPQPDETLPQPKKIPLTTLNKAATKKYAHKIYKCGQCNVYFMAQYTCYIHMLRHTPIDAKEFIECKLCNLPFKIISLNTHIKKHHKENFNLDEVLVTEYTNDGCNTPKIQIYYATDKVQSRLVSTTSDEPNLERYTESNSQPSSSSSSNDQISDDVVETSQADTSDATMNAQPSISFETVDDNTDSNDGVVEISQSDISSDVTINIQLSQSDDDNTDKIDDINSIEKVENAIKIHRCQFCGEEFKCNTSKEFHERLDHLDVEKNCMICDQTFYASILNALHLNIKNNTFECCLCTERFDVQDMANHAVLHLV